MPEDQAGVAQCQTGGNCPELTTILQRLDAGDGRMTKIEKALDDNTELTKQIHENTAGFVAFSNDLYAGTRLLCRCAKGVQFFLREIVDPYWKPALVVGLVLYWLTHGQTLPAWATDVLRGMLG